jgi:hypothetical protein
MEQIMEDLLAEIRTNQEGMVARLGAKMDSHHKVLKALMKANQEEMKATQEKTEAVAEHYSLAQRVKPCFWLPPRRAGLLKSHTKPLKDRRPRRDNGRGQNAATA